MTDSNKPISPLRQRMIEDMTMRKLSPKTLSGTDKLKTRHERIPI